MLSVAKEKTIWKVRGEGHLRQAHDYTSGRAGGRKEGWPSCCAYTTPCYITFTLNVHPPSILGWRIYWRSDWYYLAPVTHSFTLHSTSAQWTHLSREGVRRIIVMGRGMPKSITLYGKGGNLLMQSAHNFSLLIWTGWLSAPDVNSTDNNQPWKDACCGILTWVHPHLPGLKLNQYTSWLVAQWRLVHRLTIWHQRQRPLHHTALVTFPISSTYANGGTCGCHGYRGR